MSAMNLDPTLAESAARSLTVQVEEFEGPLDLLLHLVRSREIDLARLPVRTITDQYLTYLERLEFRDLDRAGEFLVMAATLIYLKSKLLLPVPEAEEDELLDEEGEEMRRELEERLRQYARFKELGQWLEAREAEAALRFYRMSSALPQPGGEILVEEVSLHDIMEAYRAFLGRLLKAEPLREVEREPLSVVERMGEILEILRHTWFLLFSSLIGTGPARAEVVVTLLALLELIRLQEIRARQAELFGEIVVERAQPAASDGQS